MHKAVILSITTCAENSSTSLVFNYAENINDGRGITFGIIGFTSGTFDGTYLIERIAALDEKHALCKYLKAFHAIDKLEHHGGITANTTGLEGFIQDFEAHGNDALVKHAQMEKLDELYWNTAVNTFQQVGATHPITLQALYDAWVNQGESGILFMVEKAHQKAQPPVKGGDEIQWLHAFLNAREEVMKADPAWKNNLDRLDMTRSLVKSGNLSLKPPFKVRVNMEDFIITGEKVF